MQEIAGKVKDVVRSLLPQAIAGTLEDPEKSKSKPKASSREASADVLATDVNEDAAVEKSDDDEEDLARQAPCWILDYLKLILSLDCIHKVSDDTDLLRGLGQIHENFLFS